jgi:DHA2 family multidrug resistance protein
MLALLPMGWLSNRVDPRYIVATGVFLIAITFLGLRYMTVETPAWILVVLGAAQTFGLGCIFVPLNLISFATLPAHLRHMGTSLFNLGRSVGGSLGLAVFMGYVAHSTDENYVRMTQTLTPFNPNLPAGWSLADPVSVKMLTFEILRQATVIAYDNAFSLLALMSAALLPFMFFLRRSQAVKPAPDAVSESAPV